MNDGTGTSSRVVVTLHDGTRYATGWGTRSQERDAPPLDHLFTGRLIARIVGSERHLAGEDIDFVTEEITLKPRGDNPARIVLQSRAPNVTPEGRKLLGGAAKFTEKLDGMSLQRVDDIINNPADTWDGWDGATVYSDHEFQVVVGARWSDTDCVMHVSVDDGKTAGASTTANTPQADHRRVSGKKSDTRLPVPHTIPDFLDRLRSQGFEIDDARRHYGISHPDTPGAFVPLPRTPSDHRWADNMVSQIRNTFGIDVRKPH